MTRDGLGRGNFLKIKFKDEIKIIYKKKKRKKQKTKKNAEYYWEKPKETTNFKIF